MTAKLRFMILFLSTGLLLTSCLKQDASSPSENPSGASGEDASAENASGEETEPGPEQETPIWADQAFLLDEESLSLPFAYKEIRDTWSIDPENELFAADTVLSPGERTMGNIPLISETWEDMLVSAGFVNLSDRDLPLEDCSVWSITMDATWAGEDGRPSLSLPGNLTWGAGAGDIKDALGEPSVEPFYSESMYYSSYTYDWQFVKDMELVVYDEEGLTMFSLSSLETSP